MRRKQFNVFKRLRLTGPEWCDILGVVMITPDGWPDRNRDPSWEEFRKKIDLPGFVARAFPSTIQFEEGSQDLNDCENFVAEDQMAAPEGVR